MTVDIDIVKTVHSGGEAFRLRSCFSTADRAVTLFGPSGSGKTLTLKAIAGLLTPDDGRIAVNGEVLFDAKAGLNLPTRRRGIGYVFQDYALFPHCTVRENVAFGLKPLFGRLGRPGNRRVNDLLDRFGLERLADCLPATLSGGQRQRTALARALATQPRLLLLDEPFNALDQPLRMSMRRALSDLLETIDIPMILVTHDLDDIAMLADTLVVYCNGAVTDVQCFSENAGRGRQEWIDDYLHRLKEERHGNAIGHDTNCPSHGYRCPDYAVAGAVCH